MDGVSAANTGVDPNFLGDWGESVLAFDSDYANPPDGDHSLNSSPNDADFIDYTAFGGPVKDVSMPAYTNDFQIDGTQGTSPNMSSADATVEGTSSGPVSPRTLPSGDGNYHPAEPWPRSQLLNPSAPAMPMETPMLFPFTKEPASANTLIVDDAGDMPNGPGFSDMPADPLSSLQGIYQGYPYTAGLWTGGMTANPADNMPERPMPLSMESQLGLEETQEYPANYQDSARPLGSRWLGDFPAVTPNGSISTFASELGFQEDGRKGQDGLQYKSENSSASGDIPGVRDFSLQGVSGESSAFAESAGDDNLQPMKWADEADEADEDVPLESSQSLTTAFMVSETPPENLVSSMPAKSKTLSTQRTKGTALSIQSAATARKRKQRTAAVTDQNQSKPLQIVQEDGQGGSIASADLMTPPRGARRKGPLSMVGRANAGMRRKNKDTCVQCRLNKRKCDGHSPCDACRPTLHEQPCARACFANIVEYGTCNYISQRAINHPTLQGFGRVRMNIPSEFDLSDLLSYLSERQGRFNIRATQTWGSLYVLDLGEMYRFLRSLSEYNGNSRSTFLEFIDRRIVESKDRSKNWLSCVKDCDPMHQVYTLLSQWNNMPSRASYSFVPLQPGTQERTMDVNNPDEQRDILLAAQLSRIVCRMLEVEGFRKLERDFYNIKWKQISHETHLRFLKELGHILLSLRWRVSWWKRLGDGGREPDPSQQHYVDRVDLLCRILYVYYTSVLAKFPSWSAADFPKGVWSHYPDSANQVWDDFPLDPTDAGFQRWVDRGRELIEEAGVAGGRKF